MRTLALLHRWLGVACCLLFFAWFTTGLVMHFVPFPHLTEMERRAGLEALGQPPHWAPAEILGRTAVRDPIRLSLFRSGGEPVYLVEGLGGQREALDGSSGERLSVTGDRALAIARAHAARRSLEAAAAAVAVLEPYDQWSVPNRFDPHRPLFRVSLNDLYDTSLYVSSTTGEVVLDTTARERLWNWAGSVIHWVYPTVLRKHWHTWDRTVWWLSLVAAVAAMSGTAVGVMRLKHLQSRRALLQRYHHLLGLACMTFVLSWIVSGWLSMDHGRLFSTGRPTASDLARLYEGPLVPSPLVVTEPVAEVEWFVLGGKTHVRLVSAAAGSGDASDRPHSTHLSLPAIAAATAPLRENCDHPFWVEPHDAYRGRVDADDQRVARAVCGSLWFHVDAATGRVVEVLDPSRRTYRWLFDAAHTFDIPALRNSRWRTVAIVTLTILGALFSASGVALAWKRLGGSSRRIAKTL